MRASRRLPKRLVRGTTLSVLLAFIVTTLAVTPARIVVGAGAQGRSDQANGHARKVKPEPPVKGAPPFDLPHLDEVKHRPQRDPETAPAITSSTRSRRKPIESRRGRKVGDPSMSGNERSGVGNQGSVDNNSRRLRASRTNHRIGVRTESDSDPRVRTESGSDRIKDARAIQRFNQTATRHHASRVTIAISPALVTVTETQFIQDFYTWALPTHSLTQNEQSYWNDILRAAYPQGPTALQNAVRELGMTLFESADYAARGRDNRGYVYDLYKTYLRREPDEPSWTNWANAVPSLGRESVRHGFDQSWEFINVTVPSITLTGSASANATSLISARVDPFNQNGHQLAARDCEWSLPLLSLPGRAGLDLGLGLSYSSQVWTRTAGATGSPVYLYFDQDTGNPSPGFRLGFATIQSQIFDAQTARSVYVVITSSGQRVELRQVGTSNIYEAADSSYLQLTDNTNSLLLRTTDGTQITYGWFEYEWRATQIKDRNGNFLTINNDWRGDIQTITDTLGRVITFNYDGNANLLSITQSWSNGAHTWATFGWGAAFSMNVSSFTGATVVGTYGGESIPVLRQVSLDDGSYYTFDYAPAGQVNLIKRFSSDNVERAHTAYDYDSPNNDCPRITQTRVWARDWTGINNVPYEVATQFSLPGDGSHQMIAPDGTIYKEFYGTGWQKGLVTQTEIWSGGVKQKWTTTSYTQDNTSVSYQTNPRVTETNIYDASGNRRRTTVSYTSYSLPSDVYEYAADAATVLRRSHTDYNLTSPYTNLRILGLPAAQYVCDGAQGATPCGDASGASLLSKATFQYDETAIAYQGAAVQHDDGGFGSGFITGRANVTTVYRYNVLNLGQSTTSRTYYNTAGLPISTTDALNHTSIISYADSFSVDGTTVSNPSVNTMAYPTSITDPDNFQSFIWYRYDFGARTRVQGPPPAGQNQGAIQTTSYDDAQRVLRVTTANTGAYTRYVYGANYVQSWSTVNSVADEAYSIQYYDGMGRTILAGANHPGSSGGYRAVWTQYESMGRLLRQSNPTEIRSDWLPWGDDSAGWVFSNPPVYDWKGRVLTAYNQDGTYKTASYTGCGCAGGEVVTLTDEVGRRQRVYSDVIGRQWKTEILNTNGSVYSTSVSVFNARDQVTLVRQWAGAENGGGAYQDTTMTYDGYGRLSTKHVPEQNAGTNTVYTYNNDDTVLSVTDARGASATYGYNGRHLVTSINYSAPAGITPTSNVAFGYDAAGNRTSMTDGLGSKTYGYNELSRMTSETRTFSDPNNTAINGVSKTISYAYNLAGELTSITDPFNAQVGYNHDAIGRTSAVTGSGFANVSSYAANFQYRAWGAVKHVAYGNSLSLDMSYNSRLQAGSFDLHSASASLLKSSYQYDADGRIHTIDDQVDNLWDRAFSYDFRGMITTAGAGSAAGLQTTTAAPYSETFAHDAFGNLTSRGTSLWSDGGEGFSANYANNRRQSDAGSTWQHDANGEVVSVTHPGSPDYQQYSMDAAGRIRQNTEHNRHSFGPLTSTLTNDLTIDQNYDGDGRRLKRLETTVRRLNNNPPVTSQRTTYEVRSSVLSQVITELNESGVKQKTYVYEGAELLAVQQKDYQGTDEVQWSHTDSLSESTLQTNASGQVPSAFDSQRQEIDPTGEAIPPTDPAQDESSYIDGAMSAGWYKKVGDPFNPESGCAWNGTSVPCNKLDAILRYSGVQSYIEYRYQGQEGAGFGISIGGYVTHKKGHWKYPQDPNRTDPQTGAFISDTMGTQDIVTITDVTVFGLSNGSSESQPQNPGTTADGHEFQHRRAPCPPTGKQLASNPIVKKGLSEAFDLSLKTKFERGGWIYWNSSTGKIFYIIKDPPTPHYDPQRPEGDTYWHVYLDSPPSPQKGWKIVADFHTHPENGGEDPFDVTINYNDKIPGIVRTPDGKAYPYGPNRGFWHSDLPSNCK